MLLYYSAVVKSIIPFADEQAAARAYDAKGNYIHEYSGREGG